MGDDATRQYRLVQGNLPFAAVGDTMNSVQIGPPDGYLYPGIVDMKMLAPDRAVALLAAKWTLTTYDAPLAGE
jgi:hypothetical protein